MSRKCLVSIRTALVALLVSRVGLSQVGFKSDSADPDDKDRGWSGYSLTECSRSNYHASPRDCPGRTNRSPYASGPQRELCIGRRSNHRA